MTNVSIIIPVRNGEKWINSCMESIAAQTIHDSEARIEIVVYNDGSIDETTNLLKKWSEYFCTKHIGFIITGSTECVGCGGAKNRAIRCSTGEYLCFQDVDDVMFPNRISTQWEAAKSRQNSIIGSQILRVPPDSTPRFVNWANSLTQDQLKCQIYTSNGPTLLMPTWFCHRSVFDRVGGFSEAVKGCPEDLIFFYSHLDKGGDLYRVDEKLLIYTYHEGAATFSVGRERIWKIQLDRLEEKILSKWKHFTVWNAGKAGRKLIRSLTPDSVNKITSFCDVDKNKIGRTIELYCPVQRKVIVKLPVTHFREAKPPFLICMKLDLTDGVFESNLKSLNLTEGSDYILFS